MMVWLIVLVWLLVAIALLMYPRRKEDAWWEAQRKAWSEDDALWEKDRQGWLRLYHSNSLPSQTMSMRLRNPT